LTNLNELFSSLKSAQDGIKQAEVTEAEAREQLATFFNEHPEIDQDRLTQLADIKPEKIEKLRKEQEQIRSDVKQANSLLTDLGNRIQVHNESKPQFEIDETAETLKAKANEFEKTVGNLREQVGGLKHELEQDENNKRSRHELIDEMERLKGIYIRWSKLSDLIGDKEGTKFRRVAQSYILGSLIRSANQYMRTLTDRYTLLVTPGTSVISIEDAYQGYARRAATTISGGESFLVSLSLALALADIGKQLAVDTMFIDEGFGTLSGEPLRCAVNTLKSLHSTAGRHVGIISHVEELRERIPVQIQVNQQGNNSSSQIQVVTI
jgi:exonuclease SbcC